jgi:hypothetical protein
MKLARPWLQRASLGLLAVLLLSTYPIFTAIESSEPAPPPTHDTCTVDVDLAAVEPQGCGGGGPHAEALGAWVGGAAGALTEAGGAAIRSARRAVEAFKGFLRRRAAASAGPLAR